MPIIWQPRVLSEQPPFASPLDYSYFEGMIYGDVFLGSAGGMNTIGGRPDLINTVPSLAASGMIGSGRSLRTTFLGNNGPNSNGLAMLGVGGQTSANPILFIFHGSISKLAGTTNYLVSGYNQNSGIAANTDGTTLTVKYSDNAGYYTQYTAPFPGLNREFTLVCMVNPGSGYTAPAGANKGVAVYLNGVQLGNQTSNNGPLSGNGLSTTCELGLWTWNYTNYYGASMDVSLFARFSGVNWNNERCIDVSSNVWRIFKAPPRVRFIASAPSNNIAGTSAQNQSASSTLSQSIALHAASVQTQSATGAMSIGLSVSGTSAQIQSASGNLNITVALNGSAIQQHVASGAVGVGVSMSGDSNQIQSSDGAVGVGVSLGGTSIQDQQSSGGLSVSGSLSGTSSQNQSATGTVGISVTLNAASIQEAFAAGTLTNTAASTISIAGTSTQSSSASGLLDVGVNLSGNSVAIHSADGTLATIVQVSGVSAQVHSASGSLIITANISAESLQQAYAVGTLSMRLSLSGASVQQALAVGTLGTTGILTPDPAFIVHASGRKFVVNASGRNFILKG